MIPIAVHLASALLCVAQTCVPALVGKELDLTPTGTFPIKEYSTTDPFYDGSVLVFHQNAKYVWAIHQVWLGDPKEHRARRIGEDPLQRRISHGCINVDPSIYRQLVSMCSSGMCTVTIDLK